MAKRDKPGKRARAGRATRQVFVASPRRAGADAGYARVYEAIEKSYDVTFLFSEEQISDQRSAKKAGSLIASCDFALFDLSGWEPNVALQLGYAMALGSPWYVLVDPSKGEPGRVPPVFEGSRRIEYTSHAELGEKLNAVVAQRYPKTPRNTIDDFLEEQRKQVVKLLRGEALPLSSLAQLLGVDLAVAELVLRPLVDEGAVRTEGDEHSTRYFVSRSPKRRSEHRNGGQNGSSKGGGETTPGGEGAGPARAKAKAGTQDLNDKERRVLDLLRHRAAEVHLDEIGSACFRGQKAQKANSWARNSLRKLVSKTLARKVGRGLYVAVE